MADRRFKMNWDRVHREDRSRVDVNMQLSTQSAQRRMSDSRSYGSQIAQLALRRFESITLALREALEMQDPERRGHRVSQLRIDLGVSKALEPIVKRQLDKVVEIDDDVVRKRAADETLLGVHRLLSIAASAERADGGYRKWLAEGNRI